MTKEYPILYLITPCFNEEEVIQKSITSFSDKINNLIKADKISNDSKLLIIDDGSTDKSWSLIKKLSVNNAFISAAKLNSNYGQQNALYTGLLLSVDNCDIAITIDIDGQHDLSVIDKMIENYSSGDDIVYAVRNNRDTDGFFKKTTARIFYFFASLLGVEIIPNHSEYRLMTKKAIKSLIDLEKFSLFLRSQFPQLHLKSSKVNFDVLDRQAGKTKYNFSRMCNLALDAFVSSRDTVFGRILISTILFSIIFSFFDSEKISTIIVILASLVLIFLLLCVFRMTNIKEETLLNRIQEKI